MPCCKPRVRIRPRFSWQPLHSTYSPCQPHHGWVIRMRTCPVVSRSRRVTVPSFSTVSPSTVTSNGTPSSSVREYRLPMVVPARRGSSPQKRPSSATQRPAARAEPPVRQHRPGWPATHCSTQRADEADEPQALSQPARYCATHSMTPKRAVSPCGLGRHPGGAGNEDGHTLRSAGERTVNRQEQSNTGAQREVRAVPRARAPHRWCRCCWRGRRG